MQARGEAMSVAGLPPMVAAADPAARSPDPDDGPFDDTGLDADVGD